MATVERTTSRGTRVSTASIVAGTVLLAGAMWTFNGGVVGILLSVAVGFVAAANGGHYGVGLSHIAALFVTSTPSLEGVAILELASIAYLASELPVGERGRGAGLLAVGAAVVIGLVMIVSTRYGTLPTAGLLVAVTMIGGYVLHRTGLYNLGLLSEETS